MGKIKYFLEIPGTKYGMLTVVRFAGMSNEKKKQRLIECICDCGNNKVLVKSKLVQGEIQSCGCLLAEALRIRSTKRSFSEAASFNHYNTYRHGADSRGYAFEISIEEFILCTSGNCVYCGSDPEEFQTRRRDKFEMSGYAANGIDRVDNSIGYVVGNIVPCCSACNKGKGKMTKDGFIKMCKAVAAHNSK